MSVTSDLQSLHELINNVNLILRQPLREVLDRLDHFVPWLDKSRLYKAVSLLVNSDYDGCSVSDPFQIGSGKSGRIFKALLRVKKDEQVVPIQFAFKQFVYDAGWEFPIMEFILQSYAYVSPLSETDPSIPSSSSSSLLLLSEACSSEEKQSYIAPLKFLFTLDKIPTIIMEYYPNQSYYDYLRLQKAQRPPGQTLSSDSFTCYLKILKDIAQGLAHIHKSGIIHRDICSRNVLLKIDKESAHAYLADFGSAAFYKEKPDEKPFVYPPLPPPTPPNFDYVSRSGASVRFRWSAPEVLLDPSTASTSSDIWSYSMIVWQTLAEGDEPFPGFENDTNIERLLSFINSGHRPPLQSHWPLKEILVHLWALSPEKRYSAAEIVEHLPNMESFGSLPASEIQLTNLVVPPAASTWCTIS